MYNYSEIWNDVIFYYKLFPRLHLVLSFSIQNVTVVTSVVKLWGRITNTSQLSSLPPSLLSSFSERSETQDLMHDNQVPYP